MALLSKKALVPLAVAVVLAAAIVVAVVFWLRRRKAREGWSFNTKSGLRTMDPESTHYKQVYRWCRSGKKLTDLMNDDSMEHLSKYSLPAASRVCGTGMKEIYGQVEGDVATGAPATDCRATCPNSAVRKTHPCMNKDKTKCCMAQNNWNQENASLQNCVAFSENDANSMINVLQRGAELRKQDLANKGGACKYTLRERQSLTGPWKCPAGWYDTRLTWSQTNPALNAPGQIGTWHCANTSQCAVDAYKQATA